MKHRGLITKNKISIQNEAVMPKTSTTLKYTTVPLQMESSHAALTVQQNPIHHETKSAYCMNCQQLPKLSVPARTVCKDSCMSVTDLVQSSQSFTNTWQSYTSMARNHCQRWHEKNKFTFIKAHWIWVIHNYCKKITTNLLSTALRKKTCT